MKKGLLFCLIALMVLAIGLPVAAGGSERFNILKNEVLEHANGVMTVQMAIGTGSAVESNLNLIVNKDLQLSGLADLAVTADVHVPNSYECAGKKAFNILKDQVMQEAVGVMTVQMNVGNYNFLNSDVNVVVGGFEFPDCY